MTVLLLLQCSLARSPLKLDGLQTSETMDAALLQPERMLPLLLLLLLLLPSSILLDVVVVVVLQAHSLSLSPSVHSGSVFGISAAVSECFRVLDASKVDLHLPRGLTLFAAAVLSAPK